MKPCPLCGSQFPEEYRSATCPRCNGDEDYVKTVSDLELAATLSSLERSGECGNTQRKEGSR